ncbi:MAG: TnpV protein [Eubacteriales bacterium]|nr:TnpV protein [Eubacteriales bacterium]
MGGTYRQVGDYFIPNFTLPDEQQKPIGIWGQRHRRYLKQNKPIQYMNLLTSGKLNSYLADIDQQAEEMFSQLVKQMADKQGVTEQLKATDQMAWVGMMNNIRNAAMEIVNKNLIFV